MKVLIGCGVIILAGGFWLLAAFSQLPKEPDDKRFTVSVSANDNEEDKRAASYIKRELRSLGDVKVVDYDSEWKLYILAMERKLISGSKVGYTLSVVVTRAAGYSILQVGDEWEDKTGLFPGLVGTPYGAVFTKLLGRYIYEQNYLTMTGVDPGKDLRWACEATVTDFDVDYLEPRR